MPANVSTGLFGNLKREEQIRIAVENFFKPHPENWVVSILGAQKNDAWEVKLKAPDDREAVRMLYGHDGGDRIERVLKVLEEITIELSSTPK